jgi:Tol biopolymer transport system component
MKNVFHSLATLLVILLFTCIGTRAETDVPILEGKLAFVTAEGFGTAGEIFIHTGKQSLTTEALKSRELEVVADGGQIIYCADDFRRPGIYRYDVSKRTNSLLLTNAPNAESPSLSPDGKNIAFVIYSNERKSSQIHTAQVDGTKLVQLTKGEHYDWNPRWSPDGRRLVFETTRNDGPENHVKNGGYRDIYVMDGNGENQVNLTKGTYGHSPSWSPDGKRIAYMAKRGIWVMNADGSEKQNITDSNTRDSEPVWSPDGRWVAFTRATDPGPMNIWIMRNDGTEQRQITFNEGNAASYSPSWSK